MPMTRDELVDWLSGLDLDGNPQIGAAYARGDFAEAERLGREVEAKQLERDRIAQTDFDRP